MAKIQVSQVTEILKKHKVDPSILREIVEEMNNVTQPDGDGEETVPAQKKQFAVLISDSSGVLLGHDLVGWVCQIPEDASPHSLTDRIIKGAYDFNASKRGRLLPVKTIGTALESVTAKYFRDAELWVKTKLPVAIVPTGNHLPTEKLRPDA